MKQKIICTLCFIITFVYNINLAYYVIKLLLYMVLVFIKLITAQNSERTKNTVVIRFFYITYLQTVYSTVTGSYYLLDK